LHALLHALHAYPMSNLSPFLSRRQFALFYLLFIFSFGLRGSLHDADEQLCDIEKGGERSMEGVSLLSTSMIVEQRIIKAANLDEVQSFAEVQSGTTQLSWTFYEFGLIPLLILTVITAWFTRPQLESPEEMTPAFSRFRMTFLTVWAVAVAADWLQGPYVYALYASFGYDKSEINKLFVAGFAASMVFGTFAGSFADAWGRKRTTLVYCVLYIVSCCTKHCSLYSVLMVGRITGGMATSLLFSAFECWMVSENNERHRFSTALLRYMFSMMYFVNYLVAILSGLFAQTFVSAVPMRRFDGFSYLYYGGNICAFDLAIIMLLLAAFLICFTWTENYGDNISKKTIGESFTAAFKAITSSWKVGIIGAVMACFEGSMYAFVINWTPTLGISGAPPPPHGTIFSAMMMSCMVGSSIFSFFNPGVNPAKVVAISCFLACLSFALVSAVCGQVSAVAAAYMGFLCFECCVGLYMPAIGALKSEIVPEESRAGVYNWYRIPLNLVVCCIVLSDLHLRTAFIVCSSLLAVGTICILPLASSIYPQPGKSAKMDE